MTRCCICHRLTWCMELEDGRAVCCNARCLLQAGCGDLHHEIQRYLEFVELTRT